jgi:threonine dehydrogenase-like Zn-dependent dehydrogenase
VARGADVAPDLPDGSRVAVDPSLFCGYCERCRAAVDLLASGAVDPGPLLGEPLPLEGFGAAVDNVRAGHGIKWHIRP